MLTRLYLLSLILLVSSPADSQNQNNITLAQQEQVNDACFSIAKKLSSITFTECLKRNLTPSAHTSNNQKTLLIKEYPPLLNKRQPQAKILLLGGIHGDEYSSVTIMFKWMKILDKYHSGLFHWKISPLVNPDGLLQKKSQRMNANGVDLNRNFPNNGAPDASLAYWKNRAYSDPRRYPGASPASEPETQWIIKLIKEFKPDAIVAVHAPFGIVDYDGPTHPPAHLGSLYLKLLGTYPGSLGNYAGLQQSIPVVTIELPYAGIMPSEQEVVRIWVDMVRWLKKNIPDKTKPGE
ncbi:Peptidase M14, carboxypeptidase A [hydrothermal vent metagenome]|uniref:Peptidase M14, carboxypeptidase A n=1 Tax=hydrothermal vent metagenome TaxID=652676 RepID=A0A3B0WYF6_9ZZZZ